MKKEKLEKLMNLSHLLLAAVDLKKVLKLATEQIKELVDVERVTIFIYSQSSNMIWTYLADGVEKLILPADKGISGYVIKHRTIKKVNDTDKEPLFFRDVDNMTGYYTRNILTLPLITTDDRLIGVLQLLNKKDGKFTAEDINIANLFARQITPPLDIILSEHNSLNLKDEENEDFV